MITKGYKISAYTLLLMLVSLCINERNSVMPSDVSIPLNDIKFQGIIHSDTLDDYIVFSFPILADCCNINFYYMV